MNALTGTRMLIRLALRLDRIRLPLWIGVFVVVAAASAAATVALYPGAADRAAIADSVNSVPAMLALYGPVYAPTAGATAVFKLGGFGAALVGLLMILTVVRHTRAEEESGRLELVGAAVTGRSAALAAALTVVSAASLVLGLVTAFGLVAAGLPWAGSFAFGLGWAVTGLAFGSLAAVTAQLTRGARTASGLAAAALVVAYVLRAVGDATGNAWLSWLSPIGWAHQLHAYAGERWWVSLLSLGFAAACAGAARRLAHRRDFGAGLLADRAGPERADRLLRGSWGLTWRLNRMALGVWTACFLALGVVIGNLAGGVSRFLDTPKARQLIAALGGESGVTDSFLAAEFAIFGVLVSVYAVWVVVRLGQEEHALRLDPLLAGAVGRARVLTGYLLTAGAGSALPLVAAGIGAGIGNGLRSGDVTGEIARLTGAAVSRLPAVWVLAALAFAVFGLAPRAVAWMWGVLAGFVVIGDFGPLLGLPAWVVDLSPFTHLPRLPGAAVSVTPLLWLVMAAVALFLLGLTAFRGRDVAT
ncbi:ABC transporter permease [Amycolatopsis sp. CA-230715]|uniref:ABC transporter permease n=1 Tax=Amycolatopsis sp. CA-230715 TaxID=2745196 RepID=UPI001C02C55A|nr:ABC transporter permease [Amycolatopsis sp. CA-230715]QWF77955.1 hypothetical protein HUW46_01348 [Amycolatopsis sp. CA-230715]